MALKIFFSHAWADKAGANVKILVNALKESTGREGQYELCELRFGKEGDLYLGNAKYFIVSLDYRA